MQLTSQQRTALKANIAANTNTVSVGGGVPVAINALPNDPDSNAAIASWYSGAASPVFNVLKTSVPVDDIYDQVSWPNYTPQDAADSTVLYQNRAILCQTKQINLQLLLQGRQSFDASKTNQRSGLMDATQALPSGASGANRSGGWTNILPILRRAANRIEQLFASQATGPGVNGGDALGATTNPALMAVEGTISGNEIQAARDLG